MEVRSDEHAHGSAGTGQEEHRREGSSGESVFGLYGRHRWLVAALEIDRLVTPE
jgi:hypothetical protein